jgi:hypothetical protein
MARLQHRPKIRPRKLLGSEKVMWPLAFFYSRQIHTRKRVRPPRLSRRPTLSSNHKDESTHTIEYVFTTEPGQIYHLRSVKTEDFTDHQQKDLEKNWKLPSGSVCDPSYASLFFQTHMLGSFQEYSPQYPYCDEPKRPHGRPDDCPPSNEGQVSISSTPCNVTSAMMSVFPHTYI